MLLFMLSMQDQYCHIYLTTQFEDCNILSASDSSIGIVYYLPESEHICTARTQNWKCNKVSTKYFCKKIQQNIYHICENPFFRDSLVIF